MVKAEDLTGEAAVEGQYSVDYSVDPVGAATIKGAHTINEGETLYFAVDPQVGYEITEVTANGEPLEEADAADVASASNLEQHEHVYAVEAVTEDLEIVASLEETVGVAHPEFSASYVSSEGVTISLHAEEGILPEGTELSVTEVTDALGDTIKEKMDSETEGTTVHSVLAYDINLLYNGKKLSNSWSESGYVDVTFTGAPIQEMTEASDKVEIVAVDDTSKTQLSAENAAEAEAGELKLETVSEQNVEDAAVEEVGFKAEHFTIYAVAASSGVMAASIEGYNATMKIGETQRLRSDEGGYSASWSSSNTSVLTVTGSGWTAMVTAVGVGTATITHYNTIYGWKQDYDTATITVTADPITGVTLTGDNKVKLFGQVQLNANLQPTTGSATLTWESSDESILTVDETGMVTGRKLGTATITVWAVDHAGHRFSAAKEITVIQATTTEKAQFYYLTTPTADPKSNNSSVWGRNIGTGKIVVTNGIWENNKNMLDSVSSRVVEWPNGTTGSSLEITRTGTYASDWNTIFEAYKAEIERKHGKTITEDDIESIKLKPYKISRNNGTNPDKHVDCTVEIKVKDVYTANYWLWDAGTTGYEYAEAGSYYKNDQTSPTASKYPNTKTVNGVTYTFLGWYDNEALSGEAVTFPYTITDHNVNFYAKYVAGYYVDYDLNGGTWGSAQTKWFKNVGSTVVVVATEPEKTGYDFTGWTYSEDGSRTYHAGDSFVMPEKNVKLTANWTPKEVSYTVNYYWAGTTIPVTKSKTVTGKHFGDVINNEEPVEVAGYTAINAQPSLTLGSTSEANIINFYYYKNVTLVANSDTFEYDGQTKTVSGYKLNGNDIVLEGITAGAEAVNAGEYPATFTGDPRGTVIDGKYIVTDTENGKLTITKKDKLTIQVTGNTNTVTYTGKEQEVTDFTTNAPKDVTVSLANGSQARAAGTTVGTYYMQLKPADFVATSDNYKNIEILVTDGWLKINPNPEELTVTITGNHDRKPYIGQPQSVSGYSDNAPANVTVALKAGKSATATGTNAGHYAMNLTPADFTVSSDNYSNIKVVVVDGYLDITPVTREVVVKIAGHHDTKTYTGEELSVEGYDVVEKPDDSVSVSLKAGHEAKAAGTNVGTYYMGLTADAFEATSKNYTNIKVEVEDGYLTITPADTLVVKVTGNTKTVTYTGEEQEVTDFTTNAPSDVTVTLKAEKVAEAKGTNAGKYYMGLTADDFTATSDNYTSIAIDVADGWLEITPVTEKLTVTITGNHDRRVYTGSEQTVTGFTSDAPATVSVHLVTGEAAKASGSDVGHYSMGLTAADFNVTSANYSNIEVIVVDGYLDITPITDEVTVTITGNHESKVYNGSEQTTTGFTTDVGNKTINVALAEGKEAKASGTNVGQYAMKLTKDDFVVTSDNYNNIKVVVVDGYLDITPITDEVTVTITGNSDTKVYNGSEQTVTGFTTDVGDKTITVALKEGKEAKASGTNAGHYTMNLTEDDFTATSSNYSKIKLVVHDGSLEITPVTSEVIVKIAGRHDTKTYTGKELSVEGYDVVQKPDDSVSVSLKAGHEAKAAGTNVGRYQMGLIADDFEATSTNYNNIKVEVEDGYLTITPADTLVVQVTGNTSTVTYTGNEQEVTGFTTNAPEDVTVSLANGSQARAAGTTVGTYYMKLKASDFVASSANYKNIEIRVTDGWLKINPNPEELTVTITGNHDTKPYTGQPQSVSGYTDNAPANVTVALKDGKSAAATGTDAGRYAMNLTAEDFTVSSDNYSNIEVVVVDGYLEITPVTREVVVKIAGRHDTKTYTGKELSVEGYDVVEKPDDSVSVSLKAGYEAKAAGTNVGTYYMGLTADAFEATSKNYTNIKVEVEDGYLTITPADTLVVKVTGNTKTVTYTGEEQEVTDFTTNAPSDVTVTLKAEKVAEAKGTNAGKYYMGLTADDFTATSANYKSIAIDVADGWLEITPVTKKLTVTITGNHDSRVYTGSEQTVTGFTSDAPATVTVDLVSGAVAQAAGTNAGKYYMELTPDNFIASSDNYSSIEVKVNDGYLEITPISEKVVVTIKGHTKSGIKYDGNVQTVRGYDVVKISNTLYKATDFELTGTAEIAKTDAGTYNMNLTAGDFKNLNKNFSNVEFVVEDGQLTIDKAPVTIKANEASKYVGEDDPADYISNPGVVTRIMRWIRPAAAFGATVTSGEVVAGDTLAFKVTRPRAGTDEERGTYTNAVKVAETDAAANANYEITWIPADFHIYEDGLKVEKTVKAPTAPKTVFELGDVMEFNIKVTNTGNTDLKDVIVRDELDGATIGANTGYTVNTDGTATIAELIAGASVNVKATYTVKAADLGNTSFTNKATATAKTENPKKPEGKVTGEDETDPIAIDSRRPAMEITKTVTNLPAGGEGFVEGDTVRFEIKVKNTGNLALSKVTVTDELADTTIEAGAGYVVDNNKAVIADLPLNTEITITASHVVTKADVANKNFKNTVTVTSKVPDPTDPGKETEGPENPAETDTIPTKGVQVQKTVTSKAAAADGKYVAGEKVTFDITVTNTGNTVLGNFRVVDQLEDTTILEGAGYDVTTDAATGLAAAVVNGLAENASITIKAEHTVTEADLRKEHFKNVAVAELTDPQNPDNPKKEEGETPDIPKVDADANWKVTKTVTNLPSRGYFRSSETAEFDIKVENTGNQTLNDIVVADLLSGAELKAGSGYMLNANGTATIATLKVGEAVTLKATYTVTSADVTNKKFVNAATASIGTETETGTTGDIPTRTTGGGNSGGGGGGGSSSGPRDNGSTPSGGPGTTTVTIDPDAVPLANLPNEDGADNLLMIDDEDVPLAALPKTGQSGTNGLVFFLSSMMLAAFVAVTKKREDDK